MTKTAKAWDRFARLSDESSEMLDAIVRLTSAACDSTDPVVRVAIGRELARARKSLDRARARRDAAFEVAVASSSR